MDCKKYIANSFNKASITYEKAATLQYEINKRLLERLSYIKCDPKQILDLGSGTGTSSRLLTKQYPNANIFSIDFAKQMLQFSRKNNSQQIISICADIEYLPIADNSVDLIYSNCTFQWLDNSQLFFKEILRVLKSNGFIIFSYFGPDTLQELKAAWQKIDDLPHIINFTDMHNTADLMLQTGFIDTVIDMEYFNVEHKSCIELIKNLKNTGSYNINSQRHNGLTPKGNIKKLINNYELYRQKNGLLSSTFEVIYAIGWQKSIHKKIAIKNLSKD